MLQAPRDAVIAAGRLQARRELSCVSRSLAHWPGAWGALATPSGAL